MIAAEVLSLDSLLWLNNVMGWETTPAKFMFNKRAPMAGGLRVTGLSVGHHDTGDPF